MDKIDPTMVTVLPEGGLPAERVAPVPALDDMHVQTPRPPVTISPMEMLRAAVDRGATIDILTKLMDLSDRWEQGQARKAFDDAIARAKSKIGPIPKNREGHAGRRYADMAGIAKVIDPIISEVGLSYRFRTNQTDRILVTCILSHRDGHYEEHTLGGPPDLSGSKNAIQAIGSALTYLQRYSLIQALGLSAEEVDDDGDAITRVPTRPIRTPPVPPHNATTGEIIGDAIPDEFSDIQIGPTKRTSEPFPPHFHSPPVPNAVADRPAPRTPLAETRAGVPGETPDQRFQRLHKELTVAAEEGSRALHKAWLLIPLDDRKGKRMEDALRACQKRAADIDEAARM